MHQQAIDFTARRYPAAAGAKTPAGPSREAAVAVTRSERRAKVQRQIIGSLLAQGPATADELAERLRLDRLYVRPRVSELHKREQIVDSGRRRRNDGGRSATVWEVA